MRKIIIASLMMMSFAGSSSLLAADAKSGTECVLTDTMKNDKTPGDAKTTFATNTPEIFLICATSGVKKGDVMKGTWVAIDTKKVAPDNYTIAEKALTVDQDVKDGQTYDSNMSLTKPDKGWPVGTYKVDLYMNDKLVNSFKFDVAK